MLALNAVLVESPESLTTGTFAEITPSIIVQGIANPQPFISDNCVLAAGKYLLTESSDKSFDATKPIFEALAQVIPPGHSVDTRRLALVVVRTVAREHNDVVRPHMPSIVPPVFASVRDMVIPVKLSAEAAFLAVFNVVDDEPAPVSEWAPVLAAAVGAKRPWRVPRWVGPLAAGEWGAVAMTGMRGAANDKAKRELDWQLRYPSWRQGFAKGLR